MRTFNSLKTALAFRFVLVATLPLALFGWFSYDYLISQQLKDADANLQSHALSVRDEVRRFLDEVQSDLWVVRETVELLSANAPAQVDPYLRRVAGNSVFFEALYVLDAQHRVRDLGFPGDSGVQRDDYLNVDLSRILFHEEVHLAAGGSPRLLAGHASDDGWSWSDVFVSPVTGNPAVMLHLPLRDGAVLGTVSLEQLATFLHRHLGQVEALEFALVDHHGTLIAHTRQQLALERANLLALHPEILEVLGSNIDVPSNLHEDGSLLESLRVVPDSGWIVHASLPVAELTSKSGQLRLVLIPTIVGAVLLASFLAFWQSRRLISPLVGLREGADALAAGNGLPLEKFGQTGYAELDSLSAHLRDMAGAVLERESFLRASEESHRQLSRQFSALLEGITDRIDLISPDLRILWSNRRGGDVLPGRNPPTPEGCCFASRFNRSEPCPECPALRCFASGQREASEFTDTGGRIHSLRAFPVKDQQGGVGQVIMISEDVTEKRAGEQQQMRANQLASLGELAAGVAHEINNPISGVINYAQLIVNYTDAGAREHDLAQRIIKEGGRIATIVRELLIFARDEDREIRLVSLNEVLSEALILCESPMRKDRIDLRIEVAPDLPLLESRSHQIEQLLLNLLVNARHALTEKYPDGDVDKILEVSGAAVELGGRPFVRIKIRDHGTGIAPQLLGKVMNPFFTTKPAGIGTGLGLSISFEIAKRHGGALRLLSDYGHWTEAVVDLPACVVEAAPRVLP